jgi:RNA polymerase-binding transcription factor DksA
MEAEERQRIEQKLETRHAELVRIRSALHAGENDSELAHLDQHPADEGSETHDREVDTTMEMYLDEEQRRIDEARRALRDGTYGTCRGCGRTIPDERLAAVPEAVFCIDCQRRFEGQHRQTAQT